MECLERCELIVVACTCDGLSINRNFKLHGTDKLTYRVLNPILQREVYVLFSDPPHLIKTTRNCWAIRNRLSCGYVFFIHSNKHF